MRYLAALTGAAVMLLVVPVAQAISQTPGWPFPWVQSYSTENRFEVGFSRIASGLRTPLSAPKPITVACWSMTDWHGWLDEQYRKATGKGLTGVAGKTNVGGNLVYLAPETCEPLTRFAYGSGHRLPRREKDVLALASAMETLAHETAHAHGYADEARPTCYGMQYIPVVAVNLGASPEVGQKLARAFWSIYWLKDSGRSKRERTSEQCYDGKALDLSPATLQRWWH